ncbi:MAG TPA: hypothetical protein DCL21_05915 [Alphaproteobacteria bacterium]|nr:hypothetical protein [Alphaproteobacteria bacterium]
MAKIILDIFLILFFIAVAGLQVYVILRIRDLKNSYDGFVKAQQEFVQFIEKARQSLMLVNSQATDVIPELKKHIEESDALMQDFSFVLARANKKIEVLQSLSKAEQSVDQEFTQQVAPVNNYSVNNNYTTNAFEQSKEDSLDNDPILARLEQLEQQEQNEKSGEDFLKSDNKRAMQQQELIEKALREIL